MTEMNTHGHRIHPRVLKKIPFCLTKLFHLKFSQVFVTHSVYTCCNVSHSVTIIIIIIIIIIVIISIIIIIIIAFMRGIYNYLPETKQVSRVYIVAAILYLHFVLYVVLDR